MADSEIGKAKPARRPLPPHLPRDIIEHQAACVCPARGGTLHLLGEDVTEVLDCLSASFRTGPELLAYVLVAKFCDHPPLYRQPGIYAREGVKFERRVLAAQRLHADDTPVPVLAPGTGKTSTGPLWAYLRDERSYAGTAPPVVRYRYTPDRRGEQPRAHLAGFRGALQADGYAGFGGLYEGGLVVKAACWAHVRRKFHDIHAASGASPLARKAQDRIGKLYAIEERINGKPPDNRLQIRQA